MKSLIIFTKSYEQALRTFTSDAADLITVRYEGCCEGLFYLCCAYDSAAQLITEPLITLLEQVAVQENPIYKHSDKLKALALDLQRTAIHAENARHLQEYLQENRALHIEGYVMFRMSEYREKLDMMMYSLIKKFNLTKR